MTAMFALLMEPASWFANVIASEQVLMTGKIDFLMSLADNSVTFKFY